MHIDTRHGVSQTVVEILCCCDRERSLTDQEWMKVAFNQHRLTWRDDTSGTAVLPRRIVGIMPPEDTRVEREGDKVRVILQLDPTS